VFLRDAREEDPEVQPQRHIVLRQWDGDVASPRSAIMLREAISEAIVGTGREDDQ
jgi:hypothetical protein